MKTITEFFRDINKAESEMAAAVLGACFSIKPKDAQSECAKEIVDMMLAKLNEISKLRKEIADKYSL